MDTVVSQLVTLTLFQVQTGRVRGLKGHADRVDQSMRVDFADRADYL